MANMNNRWFYSVCGVLAMLVFMAAGPLENFTPTASSTFTATAYADTDQMVIIKLAHTNGSTTFTRALPLRDVWLYKVVTVPHTSGTVTLQDNWDFEILDEKGVDILGGGAMNRDETNKEQAWPLHLNGTTVVDSGPAYIHNNSSINITNNNVGSVSSETYLYLLKSH